MKHITPETTHNALLGMHHYSTGKGWEGINLNKTLTGYNLHVTKTRASLSKTRTAQKRPTSGVTALHILPSENPMILWSFPAIKHVRYM